MGPSSFGYQSRVCVGFKSASWLSLRRVRKKPQGVKSVSIYNKRKCRQSCVAKWVCRESKPKSRTRSEFKTGATDARREQKREFQESESEGQGRAVEGCGTLCSIRMGIPQSILSRSALSSAGLLGDLGGGRGGGVVWPGGKGQG